VQRLKPHTLFYPLFRPYIQINLRIVFIIEEGTFYRRKAKCGGMKANVARRLKAAEKENR
jgi:hypothetical protein